MAQCKECGKKTRAAHLIGGSFCSDCVIRELDKEPAEQNHTILLEYAKVPPLENFRSPFRLRARSGRLDYLLWLVVSLLLQGLIYYWIFMMGSSWNLDQHQWIVIFVLILGSVPITLATIRRAKDIGMSILSALILSVIFFPFTQIYLALAPGKYAKIDAAHLRGQKQEPIPQGAEQ